MDDYSMQVYINDINDCVADFSYYSNISDNTVSFTNLSLGSEISNYHWSFGDTCTSSAQNPSHQYQQGGYYNVCLTVWNSLTTCYNTTCKEVTVGDQSSDCFADFIYTVDPLTKMSILLIIHLGTLMNGTGTLEMADNH